MSTTIVTQDSAKYEYEAYDSALAATDQTVDASGSARYIFQVEVDNTANTSTAAYVKVYNSVTSSVTVGTTAPDSIFFAPAGAKICYTITEGIKMGGSGSTGIVWACVTSAGTAGTSAPSSSVIARMVYGESSS